MRRFHFRKFAVFVIYSTTENPVTELKKQKQKMVSRKRYYIIRKKKITPQIITGEYYH